ncbi:uncharacterized protein CIMG_13292 [Coccidioides immitis RS]|uniref:Uncharacterized protein n=1 Tax=Coccidioides immitis (strain RS) TaxID=246410 RepID=A0A0D8JX69_COCIM|nr:uncharacterized protein CIMG_13292 [Coccidioides immitis RS]KJF60873.1 hypothetical protein CIMG_13292 [Coccidioides immitis RS]
MDVLSQTIQGLLNRSMEISAAHKKPANNVPTAPRDVYTHAVLLRTIHDDSSALDHPPWNDVSRLTRVPAPKDRVAAAAAHSDRSSPVTFFESVRRRFSVRRGFAVTKPFFA